jgi:hydroxymethylglutaryl-CoA synthase
MTGIVSYGAYLPMTRLPLALIAGRPAREGGPEKTVADYDEDAITMAVEAARNCLRGFDLAAVDGLFFASTSYALREKQGAATIAKALGLRRDVSSADHAGSLRAGTSALEAGIHAVAAGAMRTVLVVASDCRMGAPRGALEAKLGDGAVAFLLGNNQPIAELRGCHAIADELQDVWRSEGDRFTHSWEDRFAIQEGYAPNVTEAIRGLLEASGRSVGDFAKAAIYAPDARSLAGVARGLGFAPEQLADPLFGRLGNTGAAFALTLLAATLESARPGESLLLASYGDGAHAFAFEVGEPILKLETRRAVSWHLVRRRALASYDSYLRGRQLDPREWAGGADLGLSATVRFRERDADIAFVAARCLSCGQLHFPKQRVCMRCFHRDEWEAFPLSEKHGVLLSYTFDYFFPASEPPTIVAVTEVEGCRVQVQLTNARPDEVKLDMPVEYVFRKIHDAGGKPNYFWKASPLARTLED